MKVAITVQRYFPTIGGSERLAQRIAEGLVERGHSVMVVTSGRRATTDLGGVVVERFPVRGNAAQGMTGPTAEARARVLAWGADLVFNYAAQTWTTDSWLDVLQTSERPALVLGPCGFSALKRPAYQDYFARLADLLPRYDALVFHSSRYQDWDFASAAGAENAVVIPNGADDPSDGSAFRARYSGTEALVVTVSSHVRSKGHGDFIRVVDELRRGRALRGAIVSPPRQGLGRIRGCQAACQCKALVHGSWLSHVDGSAPTTAAEAIAAADVFLLPSTVECSPLVILEAAAAGTPWVSYDVGNVREIAGGCVADDRADMVRLAARVLDGQLAHLGPEGRRCWEAQHRWSDVIDRYERLFDEVVSSRRATSSQLD